ncbi:hypothetical protein I4U23_013764 [Adineta vaga]|nr:hypothetical protein I4U23_013764 [Adineta vaga]
MAENLIPERNDSEGEADENPDMYDDDSRGNHVDHRIIKGPPFDCLTKICPQPPSIIDMEQISTKNCSFMIKPFKYDHTRPDRRPIPIHKENGYRDAWDDFHVRMPCSPSYVYKNGQPKWYTIRKLLLQLKEKCHQHAATVNDLKHTIEACAERRYNMASLEYLINEVYSNNERTQFMSIVLPHICSLAIHVDVICSRSPPLLRVGSNRSVTMSQYQAASLLACAFFCLFPYRSEPKRKKEYEHFQCPNFNTLYLRGGREKVEKLRCILHYFQRITMKEPNGVITFRRYSKANQDIPKWSRSERGIVPTHLTTAKKIEDIDCVLQVDFANKYIGGGVLNSGCVQEEIRFTICPEMLVSMLVCEVIDDNECIFLVGCERYSSYRGYSRTFQYAGDYIDEKPKDNWGRKWCHLVAIDAIYFRKRSTQYHMKYIKRELTKAYVGFYIRNQTHHCAFPIATGNWGCGAFNGDRQLKAIIQLIAASETIRPLIYAAYGDKNLIESFSVVFDYLIDQRATVRDLYHYLKRYCEAHSRLTLFEYIRQTPVHKLR